MNRSIMLKVRLKIAPFLILIISWHVLPVDFLSPGGSNQHSANAFLLASTSSLCGKSPQPSQTRTRAHLCSAQQRPRPLSLLLRASPPPPSSGQYDMTRPVFDIYSFRTVRGDALAKYNSLNQSEPLRINLALLMVLTLLASPWLIPEVLGTSSTLTIPEWGGVALGLVGSTGLLLRECRRRSKQLTRLEKELQAGSLQLRVPTRNRFSEQRYPTRPMSIAAWQQRDYDDSIVAAPEGPRRVVAVSAPTAQLRHCLQQDLQVLGRRLVQANTLVVPVPTDNDSTGQDDWGLQDSYTPWLARADDLSQWQSYFDSVRVVHPQSSQSNVQWFGLSATGRSFGSGRTTPSWLQLLGQHLRPAVDLTASSVASASAATDVVGLPKDLQNDDEMRFVLNAQMQFYDALTNGNVEAMVDLWDGSPHDPQVSSIVQEGGRLDAWVSCLEDEARPQGMTVSNVDATILSSTRACTTAIECPAVDTYIRSGGTATLLAVQHWLRTDAHSPWKLAKHQTIPWTEDMAAGGTLICDGRGCVSLVRSK